MFKKLIAIVLITIENVLKITFKKTAFAVVSTINFVVTLSVVYGFIKFSEYLNPKAKDILLYGYDVSTVLVSLTATIMVILFVWEER